MSTSRQLNKASGNVDTDITRTTTGIHTVEGNVAGARAARLTKQRETESADYEKKKRKLQEDIQRGARGMDDRFNTASLEFKGQAIGLMSKEEFALKSVLEDQPSEEALQKAKAAEEELLRKKKRKEKKASKRAKATLSFAGDDEEEETTEQVMKKTSKNPNVSTDFLPDRDREAALEQKREQLKVEWLAEQERCKLESLEVVFSYWDGSGHRRSVTITKGMTIGKFLESVRTSLAPDFHELRTMSSESLMYIKEDLIIPAYFTFYDLIASKARGKSGPLFHFDVHDDVRLTNDSRVEKDESHPGKIVARGWYERNKHIFPASRWETYDPSVDRGSYSIHGAEVVEKK